MSTDKTPDLNGTPLVDDIDDGWDSCMTCGGMHAPVDCSDALYDKYHHNEKD